jgi:hypothetical protein
MSAEKVKYYTCKEISMPNVLDIPMKKIVQLTVNERECIGEFKAKKANILIKSTARTGITIKSRFKSESMLIGINDNYLASVLYRRRSFPIWIVLSVFSGLFGCLTFSGEEDLLFIGLAGWFFCLIFIVLFFTSRTARISFRLADEQDYQILFTSSAVQDTDLMSQFIDRILMNSMNHFENEHDVTTSAPPLPSLTEHDEISTERSGGNQQMGELVQSEANQITFPAATDVAHTTDQNGFEWITTPDGNTFYRPQDSGAEWTAHQN